MVDFLGYQTCRVLGNGEKRVPLYLTYSEIPGPVPGILKNNSAIWMLFVFVCLFLLVLFMYLFLKGGICFYRNDS